MVKIVTGWNFADGVPARVRKALAPAGETPARGREALVPAGGVPMRGREALVPAGGVPALGRKALAPADETPARVREALVPADGAPAPAGGALTRRQAVRLVGAVALAGAAALAVTGRPGAGPALAGEPDAAGAGAALHADGYGVAFDADVSGLGTQKVTLGFTVRATERDAVLSSASVVLRPKDVTGFYLDDVTLDLDFEDGPLAYGDERPGSVDLELEEPVASLEVLEASGAVRYAVWSGGGVSLYVLGEEPGERSNALTLMLAGPAAGVTVHSLVLHASVWDASGSEIGTPDVVVVGADGDLLDLAPSAVVRAEMPWRGGAAGWSVLGADVDAERAPAASFETVEFGTYPRSAAGDPEPIEWYVLAEEDGKKLLLAKDVLDRVPYNEEFTDVTWEACTLRAWLNADFLQGAFTDDERARIAEAELTNDDNPDYGTEGGPGTLDRVFCLSIAEAMGYFGVGRTWKQLYDDLGDTYYDADGHASYEVIYAEEPGYEALVARATPYAVARGAYVWDEPDNPYAGGSGWWLRSPGGGAIDAAGVYPGGDVGSGGYVVDGSRVGVRPALWLNL